jgi:site-specific DNA-cytosine methylase
LTLAYASLCDGIGAVHAAWRPLGWRAAWNAEIDKFALAVVAALYAVAGHRPKIRVLRKGKDAWPWRDEDDRRGEHPYLKRLVIAGALIAAEIDRVQRDIEGHRPRRGPE